MTFPTISSSYYNELNVLSANLNIINITSEIDNIYIADHLNHLKSEESKFTLYPKNVSTPSHCRVFEWFDQMSSWLKLPPTILERMCYIYQIALYFYRPVASDVSAYAAASLLIACKAELGMAPSINILMKCDHVKSSEHIRLAECRILTALDYHVTFPIAVNFIIPLLQQAVSCNELPVKLCKSLYALNFLTVRQNTVLDKQLPPSLRCLIAIMASDIDDINLHNRIFSLMKVDKSERSYFYKRAAILANGIKQHTLCLSDIYNRNILFFCTLSNDKALELNTKLEEMNQFLNFACLALFGFDVIPNVDTVVVSEALLLCEDFNSDSLFESSSRTLKLSKEDVCRWMASS